MMNSNNGRMRTGIAVILLLALFAAGAFLLGDPDSKTVFADQDIKTMAETWAEALKTRDGKPRYEMMSEQMKESFIAGQKLRSEPWNYNIGVSSPWVVDYTVTMAADSAEILYHLTDSTRQTYDKKEILRFGKENGRTVVVESTELISDWEL